MASPGRPFGSSKEKAFAEALRVAVNRKDDGGKKKLYLIADRLVTEAIKGEGWAIQQVADRLDGKPAQESMVTIDDKRDATDWSRDELVAFVRDRRADRERTAASAGQPGKLN